MDEILQDGSTGGLISGIERNLFAYIPVFGRLGEWHTDNPPGIKRAITDIHISLFNSIMDARLEPGEVEAAIRVVTADAGRRNVPVLWWTGPSTRPADLGNRLVEHGFSVDEESPGMAVELAKLNENLPRPDGLSCEQARDDEAMRQWSITMWRGFGGEIPPEPSIQAWCDLLKVADPGTLLGYTARLEGKPVATSLLFLAGGVAGIYGVATVAEARRKGIGAQVTLHALLQARERGYRYGVLEASEMGVGVYRSLGFREVCRVNSYRWKAG